MNLEDIESKFKVIENTSYIGNMAIGMYKKEHIDSEEMFERLETIISVLDYDLNDLKKMIEEIKI